MPSISTLYSIQEVSLHCSKDDCWILVDGKVYDVTSYLDDHPGGDDVILAATGRDATEDFEDAGHSKDARELMETYYIGELDDTSSPPTPELESSSGNQLVDFATQFSSLTKQYLAVPVAVVGISVAVGLLYLRKR